MRLVGQLDSPFVRRVAVSMTVLGVAFERDRSSVFGNFGDVRRINPLGRVPALVLDDGTVIVDSTPILDWLDGEEISYTAAFNVRDNRDLTRLYQTNPPTPVARCNVYSAARPS